MSRYHLFDGQPAQGPILDATARPLRYGDGLFESMRMFGPTVHFLDRHLQRLYEGCQFLGMQVPPTLDLAAEAIQLWNMANQPKAARLRLQLWRMDGSTYRPESPLCHRLLELTVLDQHPFVFPAKLSVMALYTGQPTNPAPLGNYKTASCLPCIMAAQWAFEQGFDDVLLTDVQGNISEASSSNAFFVIDGQLCTPDLLAGGLRGVMRSVLIDLEKENGTPVVERAITQAEAERATEIILSSSVRGVVPAQSYHGRALQTTVANGLLARLNDRVFS